MSGPKMSILLSGVLDHVHNNWLIGAHADLVLVAVASTKRNLPDQRKKDALAAVDALKGGLSKAKLEQSKGIVEKYNDDVCKNYVIGVQLMESRVQGETLPPTDLFTKFSLP